MPRVFGGQREAGRGAENTQQRNTLVVVAVVLGTSPSSLHGL